MCDAFFRVFFASRGKIPLCCRPDQHASHAIKAPHQFLTSDIRAMCSGDGLLSAFELAHAASTAVRIGMVVGMPAATLYKVACE